jgi:hypothetical protein
MAARSCSLNCLVGLQHPFQRFQPVGFARRLVPTQPVDARPTFSIELTLPLNL